MKVYVVYDRDKDEFWYSISGKGIFTSTRHAKLSIAYNKKWSLSPKNFIILEYNLGKLMVESKDVYYSGEDE